MKVEELREALNGVGFACKYPLSIHDVEKQAEWLRNREKLIALGLRALLVLESFYAGNKTEAEIQAIDDEEIAILAEFEKLEVQR